MQWLYKLERKYGKFSIHNLMIYITLTMACVYLMDNFVGIPVSSLLSLSMPMVFSGQIWRLITFIFLPPMTSVFMVFLALYFYYFIGSGLENAWGAFQFNVYYLCGVLGAIVAALLSGRGDNTYLNLSLFLAFAQLYPDQQVLLFFFIPVKMKYLAYVDWALFALSFIFSNSWSTRAAIIMSLVNFFIFFGPGFFKRYKNNRKYSAVRRNWKKQMNDHERW